MLLTGPVVMQGVSLLVRQSLEFGEPIRMVEFVIQFRKFCLLLFKVWCYSHLENLEDLTLYFRTLYFRLFCCVLSHRFRSMTVLL